MKRHEVIGYLIQIKEAREVFAKTQTKFASDVDAMMNRLIHEGARNFMSAEEIARAAGMPVKRIRAFMRSAGLSPSDSKTLLSKKAAEALANNSALLGIEPSEMDLMSPLAYLPMGSVMKRELQDRSVSQVTEVDEHRCTSLDIVEDPNGDGWFQCPECEHAVSWEALLKFRETYL